MWSKEESKHFFESGVRSCVWSKEENLVFGAVCGQKKHVNTSQKEKNRIVNVNTSWRE